MYEASHGLVQAGVGTALVTMRERGGCARPKTLRVSFPSFKVNTVDPSGAGDAFCAAVILKLVEKHLGIGRPEPVPIGEWIEIPTFGAATGTACCIAEGTTTSVNRENVERLLNEQGARFRRRSVVEG